jgi:hypothetical protein
MKYRVVVLHCDRVAGMYVVDAEHTPVTSLPEFWLRRHADENAKMQSNGDDINMYRVSTQYNASHDNDNLQHTYAVITDDNLIMATYRNGETKSYAMHSHDGFLITSRVLS